MPTTTRSLLARDDAGVMNPLDNMSLNVLANNAASAGSTLTVSGFPVASASAKSKVTVIAKNRLQYDATALAWLGAGEAATNQLPSIVSGAIPRSVSAAATMTGSGAARPPAAVADQGKATPGHAVHLAVLANDTDPNPGYQLSIASLDLTGTKGSVALDANHLGVTYTPAAAYGGLSQGESATDTFRYTVTDGHGGASTAQVTVRVDGGNVAPLARADQAAAIAGKAVTIRPLANDTDANLHDTLKITSLHLKSTHGQAVLNKDGSVTYTPPAADAALAAGRHDTDSFGYTISDGHGGTSTATVTVDIASGAQAKTTVNDTVALTANAIYVSPNGNDHWSGRLAAPNADGTDGPLATLQAARNVMQASPTIKTVYIRGGDYYLDKTLSLYAGDAGESWLAYPGETPVLHGGKLVTGWTQGANGVWTATAPAGAFPQGGALGDLFVGATRETHARYPDAAPANPVQGGWLVADTSLPGQNTLTSFQYKDGDLPSQLAGASDLWVSVYEQNGWRNDVLPVRSINATTHTITLAGSAEMAIGAGSRYFLFNAANQLNAADEWYYNPATNLISYRPGAAFTGTAVAGALSNVIEIAGTSNVTISGLTIADTASNGTGIAIGNSSNVTISGDTIRNTGKGIYITGTSKYVNITGNDISATNDTGVRMDAGTGFISVTNNHIHNIGVLEGGASGIWFTGSSNDSFTHNLIENVAKFAIGGGSVIGASDASYNDVISYNQIRNANLDASDGGAIMIAGRQQTLTNDVISYNDISGTTGIGTAASPTLAFLPASALESYAIYLDDYASGVAVTGNFVRDNINGALVHAGWSNAFSGNLFLDNSGTAMEMSGKTWLGPGVQAATGNLFTGNVVVLDQSSEIAASMIDTANGATWDNNLYAGAGLGSTSFLVSGTRTYPLSFLGWQAQGAGYDATSRIGNPGFINAAGGDYRFGAGSDATAMGIASLPFSSMGLLG